MKTITSELNTEVFKRASDAGIDVSSIARQLLGAVRDRPKRGSLIEDLSSAYESFYKKMADIMLEYSVEAVKVGCEDFDVDCEVCKEPIYWTPKGFFIGEIEGEGDYDFREYVYGLFEPIEIICNLISTLATFEDRRRRIKDLELALLSVESMSKDYGHKD